MPCVARAIGPGSISPRRIVCLEPEGVGGVGVGVAGVADGRTERLFARPSCTAAGAAARTFEGRRAVPGSPGRRNAQRGDRRDRRRRSKGPRRRWKFRRCWLCRGSESRGPLCGIRALRRRRRARLRMPPPRGLTLRGPGLEVHLNLHGNHGRDRGPELEAQDALQEEEAVGSDLKGARRLPMDVHLLAVLRLAISIEVVVKLRLERLVGCHIQLSAPE